MPEDDFYTPTDADALRMENELLAFEVEFLRARYADRERAIAEARREAEESVERKVRRRVRQATADLRRQLEETRKRLEEAREVATMDPGRKARLERAEKDLVLLLNMISSSPAGPLLRLKPSFRELERRYLRT
ncbi:hypothetical protein RxyAA322_24940 [Rubrobacter xylanophilus]|uniref:Uncharacterized protein n=1 Tax=Rubrobacter xylanophilus TaxID=49319 RepID=A0A510HKV5_9ACTN|nr:hypothetical protein [Rubrobacter xylanophilus]BBL80640.1 hypothetical protein RxyAA322_24940 [Rubrobacter xylanophilus]